MSWRIKEDKREETKKFHEKYFLQENEDIINIDNEGEGEVSYLT